MSFVVEVSSLSQDRNFEQTVVGVLEVLVTQVVKHADGVPKISSQNPKARSTVFEQVSDAPKF